jgi:hypothetical protein
LAECDQDRLTVGVSDALYHVGDTHFKALARTMAVGPECPACRNPPRR